MSDFGAEGPPDAPSREIICQCITDCVTQCEETFCPADAQHIARILHSTPGPRLAMLSRAEIEAEIQGMIREKALVWTAEGIRVNTPHETGEALLSHRSESLERRLAHAVQTSNTIVAKNVPFSPASVSVTPPTPAATRMIEVIDCTDRDPNTPVPSRGAILNHLASRRPAGATARLLNPSRDRPHPSPQLLSSVNNGNNNGSKPSVTKPPVAVVVSDDSSVASPGTNLHSSRSTASTPTVPPSTDGIQPVGKREGPISLQLRTSGGSKQSFMNFAATDSDDAVPVPVHTPKPASKLGKHSREAVEAMLSTPTPTGIVEPSLVSGDTAGQCGSEWLSSRSKGNRVKDLITIASDDEDDDDAYDFRGKRIKVSDVEPVELFRDLSKEQRDVMTLVETGQNVFFTGSAGTGKSFLLKRLVTRMKAMHDPDSVFVTASTGIAACAIEGVTLHSFAGIGLGKDSAEDMAQKMAGRALQRWRTATVLFIDEISMIDGELFDKLEYVARYTRRSKAPFGGIQVILSGDFFQLPPVSKGPDHAVNFCFQSKSWNRVVPNAVVLGKVFRQKEATFADVLNELRVGRVSPEAMRLFEKCSLQAQSTSAVGRTTQQSAPKRSASFAIDYTVLFAKNVDVDAINNSKLRELPGHMFTFNSLDQGEESMLKNLTVPAILNIKVGAQVVLLKNLSADQGLVNGSRGVVVDVREADLDDGSKVTAPLVRFDSGAERLCTPEVWAVEMGKKVVASRTQVPLRLAWALSMHKSQGMSIDKLRVNLSGVFEYGQAYVALSRATSIEGLILEGFKPSLVRAHPDVVSYYKALDPKMVVGDTRGGSGGGSNSGGPVGYGRVATLSGGGGGGGSGTRDPPAMTSAVKRSPEVPRVSNVAQSRLVQTGATSQATVVTTQSSGSTATTPHADRTALFSQLLSGLDSDVWDD